MSDAEHKLNLIIARDSHAVGSPTTNGSAITAQTVTLAKEINTTLAILVVVLTIGTYWFLMRHTRTLSNEIILPSKFLEDNITAVLSPTWPKHYIGPANEIVDYYPFTWVLFYKGTRDKLLGFDDGLTERYSTQEIGKSYMVTVKTFSPVMKNPVQIAIWNYVSLWLVLVITVNTLVYNGFLSHGITNDSVLRLGLVGVYAIASIGHRYRTTTLLYRNFTSVLFQTCWTIICKKFVFGEYSRYASRTMADVDLSSKCYLGHIQPGSNIMVWTSLDFELFGTTERSDTYQDEIIAGVPRAKAQDKIESKFDNFVKPIREAEVKAYEKATDAALEKTLANVAVLLAICLATALAPWNSAQTISATSAQLGSYALLLSISAGFLALISSMTQLTNATESARILLLLQEKTIAAHNYNQEDRDVSNFFSLRSEPDFSLSKDIKGKSQFTSSSLWRSTSLLEKLPCLILGPALMLIPHMHGIPQSQSMDYLPIKVQGVQLAWGRVGSNLVHIFRPLPIYAVRTNENDNIVEHQQENPGTGGKFDISDSHE